MSAKLPTPVNTLGQDLKRRYGFRVRKLAINAVDYLIYGYLQLPRDQLAREALDELMQQEHFQPGFVTAYGLAAARTRYALERERWDEATALRSRVPQSFDWDRYPAVVAITEFARGLGAARSGKPAMASGSVLPARELLGDMLLEMGLHAEALTAYNSALAISPNRLRSRNGAMQAADAGRLSAN